MSLVSRLAAAPVADPGTGAGRSPVHDQIDRLAEAFAPPAGVNPEAEGPRGQGAVSPAEACLEPALQAIGWLGTRRQLAEALPHFDQVKDFTTLRSVLGRLNQHTRFAGTRRADVKPDKVPYLYATDTGHVEVIIAVEPDGRLLIFDGTAGGHRFVEADATPGRLYQLHSIDFERHKAEIAKRGWLAVALSRFRPLIVQVFFLSLLVNLSALALPLFVMHVYDLGIGTKSKDVVLYLALGAAIVITTDLVLRGVRGRAMAYFGARFDALVAMSTFQQLLHLPVGMTETAPIGAQITRLRQFEGLRDIFTGTLATAVVDIPFILLFLAVIAGIGGHLVWVPVALIIVYVVMALVTVPMAKLHVSRVGDAKTKHQNLVIEMLQRRSTLRDLAVEDVWLERAAKLAREHAAANYTAQQFNGFVQTLSQVLVTVSGAATLGLGAYWAITGQLSPGALIATMALVWKVLSPLQQTFLSVSRIEQALQSFQQIDKLMRLKLERDPGVTPSFNREFRGAITLNRVVFRYPTRPEPALRGLQLAIAPGELVAVTGPSGAGKSTTLKVILGLYAPQSGAVAVDGLDIRQLDQGEWRNAIGYVPENPTFFYGTVAQNLRLANPTATDAEVARAAREAGLEPSAQLPDWLETRLTGALVRQLPEAVKQRIMLARAYVKAPPIYLLDNPAANLDAPGEAALIAKLQALKGQATVIFTTFRPSLMKLADRLVYIEQGAVGAEGAPAEVLAKLEKAA